MSALLAPRSSLNKVKYLPLLGIFLAAVFWIVDTLIDVFIFEEEHTFLQSFFTPEPVELWMRSLVVVMMVLFGFIAQSLLNKQQQVSDELNLYKTQLEDLVQERTNDLERTNQELQAEIHTRRIAEEELEKLAILDPLTGLFNRRKFDEVLEYEIEQDRRYRTGLALIFCDIDHFKNINDQYGHHVGDTVLNTFAALVVKSVRASDIVARWGGEEFVLLFPNATADVAAGIAEKLRKLIEMTAFPQVGKVTASFGVTHFMGQDDAESMIRRADKAVYMAKENGRNRVVTLME